MSGWSARLILLDQLELFSISRSLELIVQLRMDFNSRRHVERIQPSIEIITNFDGRTTVDKNVLTSLPKHIPEL